ncbi:sodium:solute symporter family transporter [Guptibacillus hwajinpoensis]|uniref:sodium:solute symporter family transporter n=1 Tax=Guptibacillus hwajinpoensis TaxID=208199 RepID=UPI001CFE61DD|nr:sodium/solute symporter [Pseudalkalibacillus hwajinpoensis]WLR59100.1 sodium/solute symporter [Pseudalkalibacillus hwajinpoensis]
MSPIDIALLVLYMLGLVYMGFRLSRNIDSQEDYFIGGRSVATLPIALSIAATTVSANGFIGGPGWAYDSGLIAFMLNFSIPLVLAVALSVFLPFFYNLKVTSIYEYIELRLGGISRLLAVVGFVLSNIIQVGSFLFIPALIIQKFTGWSLTTVVPIVVTVSILYTLLGGIKAVIWTDAIQMVVLWGGLLATIGIILANLDVGFFEAMGQAKAEGKLDALDFSLDLQLENGVWVALIGGFFLWLKYYATDQTQTQRMLAAKSVTEVKRSICISGFVMNIMFFVFMIVGVLLYIAYDGKEFANSNNVMITFIAGQIPVGVLGLLMAGIFAAAMSSIDSVLNSVTTVFVKDIYEKFITKGEEASLRVSMIFTFLFGMLLIVFTLLAFGGTSASILKVVGSYLSYFSGSILAMFLLAMLTKRATDKGVAIGFVLGIALTAYIGKMGIVNWLWNYPIGCALTLLIGYLASLLFKKQKVNYEEFTLIGQRAKLLSEGADKDENGVSILPGTMDKYSYVLIGFFVVQTIILALIQL